MTNHPETTFFVLQSLDGKITTGDTDELDTDTDFRRIAGIQEGFHQYYDIETNMDWSDRHVSLSSGKVMAKIGVNTHSREPEKMEVSFVIIDRKPHLTENGVRYLTKWVKRLYLVTNNGNHPAFNLKNIKNLEVIYYPSTIDLEDLLERLKRDYAIEKITVQTGGTLTSVFLKKKLIDHVSVVIAPCLIGGKDTSTSVDGKSLHSEKDSHT